MGNPRDGPLAVVAWFYADGEVRWRITARGVAVGFGDAARPEDKAPGRTEGVRKIAARFGVNASTVQRINTDPFVAEAA